MESGQQGWMVKDGEGERRTPRVLVVGVRVLVGVGAWRA